MTESRRLAGSSGMGLCWFPPSQVLGDVTVRRANVTIEQRIRDTMEKESFAMAFDDLRLEPEYELEAWLAYRPENLQRDPEEFVEEFAERWEIELTEEVRASMLEAFERVKRTEEVGMKVIEAGSRVRALVRLVEEDVEPDPNAEEGEPGWVHAEAGDYGDVVEIRNVSAVGDSEDDEPAVGLVIQFDESGTMTMCFPEEVEAL